MVFVRRWGWRRDGNWLLAGYGVMQMFQNKLWWWLYNSVCWRPLLVYSEMISLMEFCFSLKGHILLLSSVLPSLLLFPSCKHSRIRWHHHDITGIFSEVYSLASELVGTQVCCGYVWTCLLSYIWRKKSASGVTHFIRIFLCVYMICGSVVTTMPCVWVRGQLRKAGAVLCGLLGYTHVVRLSHLMLYPHCQHFLRCSLGQLASKRQESTCLSPISQRYKSMPLDLALFK